MTCLYVLVSPTDDPEAQTNPDEEHGHVVRKRFAESLPPFPVAAVIIHRTLGHLLPERYDPDRRSLRYEILSKYLF